jgi:hypothetical protein
VTRAALSTLAVAAATLAVVVGAGFALQAASLGRPSRDSLLVVRAVARLVQYHSSRAKMTVNGKRLSAVCTQNWPPQRHDATVRFAGGPTLVEHGFVLTNRRGLAVGEFALAGCPGSLAKWLATQLNRGAPIEVRAALLDRRRVFALRFPTSPLRLEIELSRATALPLFLRLSGEDVQGTSLLGYGPVLGGARLAPASGGSGAG